MSDPIIATIGNFDGMHLGHQAIMQRVNELKRLENAQSCVVTFDPLPLEAIAKQSAPARLQGTRDRLLNFKNSHIDQCLWLTFNEAFSQKSADDFIENVLLKNLNLHTLIVGDDFHFGHQRSGNFQTLQAAGNTFGFNVEDTPSALHEGERISSSRVRTALQNNDFDTASALLGRPYRISGRVKHGEKVGRQLGFPTANIGLKKQTPPMQGVFGVKATCEKTQTSWTGVANLGRRPTVNGLTLLLEVHLLDADVNLYGEHLSIDFHHFIRGEKRFESLDALKTQIQKDADKTRSLFAIE